jgi:hypothetical protein
MTRSRSTPIASPRSRSSKPGWAACGRPDARLLQSAQRVFDVAFDPVAIRRQSDHDQS